MAQRGWFFVRSNGAATEDRPYKLEIQATLNFDDPSGECSGRSAKIDILYVSSVSVEAERLQVKNIEDIKEVCLDFKIRTFAQQS